MTSMKGIKEDWKKCLKDAYDCLTDGIISDIISDRALRDSVTEAEMQREWEMFDMFDDDEDDAAEIQLPLEFGIKDKYKLGDNVFYKSEKYVIDEICGENSKGVKEFYIVKYPELTGAYVTEREICHWDDRPLPPIPQNSCKHPKKYLNKISNTLEFWYCPDCKDEVK